MHIQIKKIKQNELENYISSAEFSAFSQLPISTRRVKSYINNPNANANNYVLYMAFLNQQLVGYRTILEDVFFENMKPVHFGWLSGNWVRNDLRRKGISTKLLEEVLVDWKDHLMFSNYAEASKLVYDKTENFQVFKNLKGFRYYYKFCFSQVLPNKNKVFKMLKPLLVLFDFVLNVFVKTKVKSVSVEVDVIKKWNDKHTSFLQVFKEKELFKRDKHAFQWIIQYPWIGFGKIDKKAAEKYHFSLYASLFTNDFYELRKNGKIIAIVQLLSKEKELKIPYVYALDDSIQELGDFIHQYINKNNIHYVTCYHHLLNVYLRNSKSALFYKSFSQKFFCTNALLHKIQKNKNFEINPGDGDSSLA